MSSNVISFDPLVSFSTGSGGTSRRTDFSVVMSVGTSTSFGARPHRRTPSHFVISIQPRRRRHEATRRRSRRPCCAIGMESTVVSRSAIVVCSVTLASSARIGSSQGSPAWRSSCSRPHRAFSTSVAGHQASLARVGGSSLRLLFPPFLRLGLCG